MVQNSSFSYQKYNFSPFITFLWHIILTKGIVMLTILKNHSLLYVEDEPEIQENMVEYLEAYFSTVYVASDGKEALILYKKHLPDVAILDIELPFISGLTLARSFRKSNQNIKLIMLTGHTETELLLEATELQLTKYLVKPISPKKFKEMLLLLSNELKSRALTLVELSQGYTWDREKNRLQLHGKRVTLNEKEQRLLQLFMTHKNKTVSYETIMVTLWEDSFEREISIDSVKNQVSNLRKKLPKDTITSVYGQGYILN